ncbi:uncharacterized protein J8A68_004837 [[Candida] subhashii]|uniref:Uncharacterized protein n=1 Tax=[Candida] subhashii TaxID=561895 RepID=A0A8J5UWL2_9ASCO|nr:uncharacterized protein J8A68_004837 [[Candida] subhashii]KAG7661684.1 hypothetical protein J8A68_004837 [[Candida] subhashii]
MPSYTASEEQVQDSDCSHQRVEDTQVTSDAFKRVANPQELFTLYATRNFQRIHTIRFPSNERLNHIMKIRIDKVAHIMKFKIELKNQLQDAQINYDNYSKIPDFNNAAQDLFDMSDLSPNSQIFITESDFADFKSKTLEEMTLNQQHDKVSYHPNYDSIDLESFESYIEDVLKPAFTGDQNEMSIIAQLTYSQVS